MESNTCTVCGGEILFDSKMHDTVQDCEQCGEPIRLFSENYERFRRKPQKKSKGYGVLALLSLLILGGASAIAIGMLANPDSPQLDATTNHLSPGCTEENYARLELGMSISQVIAILGEPDQKMFDVQAEGFTAEVYVWDPSLFSGVSCAFNNGELASMSQINL